MASVNLATIAAVNSQAESARNAEQMPSQDFLHGSSRSALIDALKSHRMNGPGLKLDQIDLAAELCGVSRSTIYRWIDLASENSKREYSRFRLTPDDRAAVFACRGDVTQAYRLRANSHADLPSLSTFRRAVARELDAAALASARHGLAGRDQKRIVLKHPDYRRNERWEGDHTMLKIQVSVPGRERPARPWLTWFIDAGTRAITGWALTPDRPTRGEVLAAIRVGVLRSDEELFFGRPEMLVWDNGREFTSKAVAEAALMLGCEAIATRPYSPQEKPFVERVNQTLDTELLKTLPHYVRGARDKSGDLYDKRLPLLTLGDLASALLEWITAYNFFRPHSSLGGNPPAEAWRADNTPIVGVSEERVRHFTKEWQKRKVRHDGGVHFGGVAYVAPELLGLEGKSVDVGTIPMDATFIEIFYAGSWLCTAHPTRELTKADVQRLRAKRKELDAQIARDRRRATRLLKSRIATITPEETEPRELATPARESDDAREAEDLFGFGIELGSVE